MVPTVSTPPFEFAKDSDGVLYRRRDREGRGLRGMRPAAVSSAVLEQFFDDFLAGLGLHSRRGFVRCDPERSARRSAAAQDPSPRRCRGALRVERLDDGFLNFGSTSQSFGRHFFVRECGRRLRARRGQVFYDVRNVGGMELGQTCVRDFSALDAAGGSVSMRSTKVQGMVRGGIFWTRSCRAVRGARPRRRRRPRHGHRYR